MTDRTSTTSLSIGDLSRLTGASRRSLRHYEAEGLLASRRLANGYRTFGPEAVARVQSIRSLLELGLPLRQARQVLPCVEATPPPGACDQAIALLGDHGTRLAATAQKATRQRDATARLERKLSVG